MINNPIIFYIASVLIISFAFVSMFAKNIIYSLLAAIVVFFSASIFFYILGSEYNAIIQAAIYGFAVPVIIGLSVMFTNKKEIPKQNFTLSYLSIISMAIFILAFVYILMISFVIVPNTFHFSEIAQINPYDVISAFARGIFIDYVWAFELLSLLLTIIIAGLTMLGIKKHGGKRNV